MTAQSFHCPEPIRPSESEIELARNSSRVLASLNLTKTVDISLTTGNHHQSSVVLPLSAFKLLVNILTQMAEGNAVTLIPNTFRIDNTRGCRFAKCVSSVFDPLIGGKEDPFPQSWYPKTGAVSRSYGLQTHLT
jgi:hypothetical protein